MTEWDKLIADYEAVLTENAELQAQIKRLKQERDEARRIADYRLRLLNMRG